MVVNKSKQIANYNECTHSAEPSPQVWLGKKNDYWQVKILDSNNNYYNYYTEIMRACYNLHSSPTHARIHNY